MDDYFLSNLILFSRLLRSLGLDASTEQVSDLARILDAIGIAPRADVHAAARAVFVRRREDLATFDRAFELFFSQRGKPQQSVIDPTQAPAHRVFRPKNIRQLAERETRREESPTNREGSGTDRVMTYSPMELLRHKDFAQFTDEEMRAARQMIAAMDWRLGERRTRRKRRAPRGDAIDFTRLLRRNLRYGAELFRLPVREPKWKPRPLVVLADISGSMERYTRMVLHLLHALYHEMPRAEIFLFGTQLTRVTMDLHRRNVDAALAQVSQRVPDWSGGTRIGEALKSFNFKWARRVLRSGAVVLILSDGWDCGDLELLRDEMLRLRRSCYRLIWLSPLVGDSESLPQGLQVAQPFVDDFMPVHNLASLEMLVAKLSMIDTAHPLRRQQPRADIPTNDDAAEFKPMELPQMGTSDYVRRTMMLRAAEGGAPIFQYEENPGDKQP
jgi:uncharacterized protein